MAEQEREPLLIKAIRRMAQTHPHRHVRITSGAGTTAGGFVAELDDWLASRDAALIECARIEGYEAGLMDPGSAWMKARAEGYEARWADAKCDSWKCGDDV